MPELFTMQVALTGIFRVNAFRKELSAEGKIRWPTGRIGSRWQA
jgi:hypothetical protein